MSEETENEEKSDETAPEEETQPEEADEAEEEPAEETASDEAPVMETTPRPIGRRRRRRLPKPGKNRPMLRLSRIATLPNSCLKSLRA